MPRHFLLPIVLVSTVVSAFGLVSTSFVRYGMNVLPSHHEWTLKKRTFKMDLLGARQPLSTRDLIARNAFHPGAWYSFQEIDTRETFRPAEIKFRFRLPTEYSNVAVLFGQSTAGFAGVRLSRDEELESASFTATPVGAFLERRPLPSLHVRDGGWHEARLIFGGGANVTLDGGAPSPFLVPAAGTEGDLGFRGGHAEAEITDITIRDENGHQLVERFAPEGFYLRILAANLLAGLVFVTAVAAVAIRRKKGFQEACLRASAILATITILIGGGAVVDRFWWSSAGVCAFGQIVPRNNAVTSRMQFLHAVEVARFSAVNFWNKLITGRDFSLGGGPRGGYPEIMITSLRGGALHCPADGRACHFLRPDDIEATIGSPKGGKRLLFVGTSQTFGCGADDVEDTFFALTTRKLRTISRRPLEALNIAKVAGLGPEIWKAYQNTYVKFRPDLVLVDLGFNDDPDSLTQVVTNILQTNRTAHIKTVLVAEPVTFDLFREVRAGMSAAQQLREKNAIVSELGRKFSVPVLPAGEYLNSPEVRDRGFLWWDAVHLSSAGQALLADWLAPRLAPLLYGATR